MFIEYSTYISRLEAICNFLQSVERVHGYECMQFSQGVLATKSPLEHPKHWKGLLPVHTSGGSSDSQELSGCLKNSPQLFFRQASKASNFARPLQNLKSSPWQRPSLEYFTLKHLVYKYFIYRN